MPTEEEGLSEIESLNDEYGLPPRKKRVGVPPMDWILATADPDGSFRKLKFTPRPGQPPYPDHFPRSSAANQYLDEVILPVEGESLNGKRVLALGLGAISKIQVRPMAVKVKE